MSDLPPSRRLNTDLIVSGAAIFISVCTLVVLLYEASVMREQQRASVWPYVEVGMGFNGDGLHVITYNQGIGPALIQRFEAQVDGEVVGSWPEMFAALGVADSMWAQDVTNGRVMPAQSQLRTLQAAGGERAAVVREAFLGEAPRLAFELCYCSVYDECWQVAVQGLRVERTEVAACASDEDREVRY